MAPGFMYSAYPMHPVFGLGGMMFTWLIQLVIACFADKDAKKQILSAPLWFILVILPMVGFLLAVLYVILREVRMPIEPKNTPVTILKERFFKRRDNRRRIRKRKRYCNETERVSYSKKYYFCTRFGCPELTSVSPGIITLKWVPKEEAVDGIRGGGAGVGDTPGVRSGTAGFEVLP